MTDSQKKALDEISQKKRKLESPEGIIDLLIEFFTWSIEEYAAGKSKFTSIMWKKATTLEKKEWTVGLFNEFDVKSIVTKDSLVSQESELNRFMNRLENVEQDALEVALKQLEALEVYEVRYESNVRGIQIL